MNITDVKISLKDGDDRLKAFVSVTLDGVLVIKNIRVVSGNNGYFVSMPSKRRYDGTFQDIIHPINTETRIMFENKILDAYEQKLLEVRDVQNKINSNSSEEV